MTTWQSLRDAVLRRRQLVLLLFILSTLAATAAIYVRLPTFESAAAVLINVERFGVSASRSDVRQDVAVLQAVEAVTSQAEILRSRELVEKLADKLDPKIFERPPSANPLMRAISTTIRSVQDVAVYGLRQIKLLPPANPHYDIIKTIEGCLDINTVRQAQVIRISCRADNPDTAQTVLRTMLETYIAMNANRKLDAEEGDVLRKEATRVRGQLEDAEQELFTLRAKHGIADLGGEKSLLSDRINRLTTVLEGAPDSVVPTPVTGAARAVSPAGGQVERKVLDVPGTDGGSGGVSGAQVNQLRSQLNSLRVDRAGLSTQFSPSHTRVRAIDAQIESIDTLLKGEIKGLTDSITGYKARLQTLLAVEPQITRLSRNVGILSDTYEVYRKATEDRQIMRQQESLVQVQIIDPPSVPYQPRGPSPLILLLAAIAGALVLSLGIAIALSFLNAAPRMRAAE